MTPLSALMPALGQGLAAASAARDPRALALVDVAENRLFLKDLLQAGLGTVDALRGNPGRFDAAMQSMQLAPLAAAHSRRSVPLDVSPVVEALPALGAGALTYGSGAGAGQALGAGLGHYSGAGLADALAKHLLGPGITREQLVGARMAGGLGGQLLGQMALEGLDERT